MTSPVQETDGWRPPAPLSVLAGVLIALCAVLLVKWLAVAALVALALYALVRWGLRSRRDDGFADEQQPVVVVPEARVTTDEDCSWCGLAGGHRDIRGRIVRPRHAHAMHQARHR